MQLAPPLRRQLVDKREGVLDVEVHTVRQLAALLGVDRLAVLPRDIVISGGGSVGDGQWERMLVVVGVEALDVLGTVDEGEAL